MMTQRKLVSALADLRAEHGRLLRERNRLRLVFASLMAERRVEIDSIRRLTVESRGRDRRTAATKH